MKAENIKKYYTFGYIRSACQISGSKITYVVQKVHSKITPTNKYEGAMTGPRVIERIRNGGPRVEVNPNPRLMDLEKLKAMAQVVSQMCSSLSWKLKEPEVKPLFFIEEFLNMFNDDDKYSIPRFQTVVGVGLTPHIGDPIFDPSHELYNPSIAVFWTRFINRHTVSRDPNTGDLRLDLNDISEKDFYRAWLTLIQNDILRSGSIGIFGDYIDVLFGKDANGNPDLTKPKKFSNDRFFEQNEVSGVDESILINIVNDVLVKVFGYTGFALIFSGMMSFTEDSDSWMGIRVDSLLFSMMEMLKLFNKFGIKAFNARLGELERYDVQGTLTIRSISSWLLSGFSHIVHVKKTSEFGVVYHKPIALRVTPDPSKGVLGNYFSRYTPNKPYWYSKASSIFINREYNKFTSQINLHKENTFGRGKLQELLFRKIDEILTLIFLNPNTYQQYPEFQNYPEFWYQWTRRKAHSIVRQFIDQPTSTKTTRFATEIRNAIMNQRDAHINIKKGKKGILRRGIKITIPYSELLAIKDDIYYTLVYDYSSSHHEWGYTSPEGYFLEFRLLWSDDFRNKIIRAYNILLKMFEFGSGTYYMHFYTKSGTGVTTDNSLPELYGKYGFTSEAPSFNPQILEDRARAAQDFLFYGLVLPEVFINVKVVGAHGAESFLLADIFSTYSSSEIRSSTIANPLSPISIWDESIRNGVFKCLDKNPLASDSDLLEAALIEENDPPIWSEILDYLIFHPETTDQQLIELYQDEDEEMLEDFNRRFKSALESLPMTKLQWELGQIFSPTDIRYFLGFHDEGLDSQNAATQRKMIRLMWQEFFRKLFNDMYREDKDKYYPGTLDDLTEDNYLTGPP